MKYKKMNKLLAMCCSVILLTQPIFAETVSATEQQKIMQFSNAEGSQEDTVQTPDEPQTEIYKTTIYFKSNDERELEKKQKISSVSSDLLRANTFKRKGYTFKEWNTQEDGLGESYKDQAAACGLATEETDGDTVDLYAQWSLNAVELKAYMALSKVDYKVSFKKNPAADRYRLEYSTNKEFTKSKKKLLEKDETEYKLENLTPGKTYYVRVCCYAGEQKSEWSVPQQIKVSALSAVKLNYAKSKKIGSIQLKFHKNAKADGYQLQYASNKKFSGGKYLTISKKKTSCALNDLALGKTYYMRIRCYYQGKTKKAYSAWSNVKKVNCSKLKTPKIKTLKIVERTEGVLTYKKIKAAKQYEIQYSTKKNFKGAVKMIVDNKVKSVKLKGLLPGIRYYVRIRGCANGVRKNYYSSWSKVKSLKTQPGSVINNTPSVTAIESDITLNGTGGGFHAKLVICTATSAVSYGIQYDAYAVAPYTGKAMAMVENVSSNEAGGQQYIRPGNIELQVGKKYHMMLTIDENGNGGVYLDYKKIGTFSNPALAHQTLTVRVEGSARRNGDRIDASFQNIKIKNGASYDPNRIWNRYEFKTNPTLTNRVDANGNITISGIISGLSANGDWDNEYGSVSDIIQFY